LIAELPDTRALHKETVDMFVGPVCDIAGEPETHPACPMEVIDAMGKPSFRLRLFGEFLE
jgi:hypothetical protein